MIRQGLRAPVLHSSRPKKRYDDGGADQNSRGAADCARDCLRLLAQVLLATGQDKKALRTAFRKSLASLKEPSRRHSPPDPDIIADLPHVLSLWHGNPRYLKRGSPKPLPFRAEGPCLAEIIGRVFPGKDPVVIRRALARNNGLRRKGALYEPTGRNLVLDAPSARIHALISLRGFLSTLESNVAGGYQCIQRTAINSRYNLDALPTFHANTRTMTEEALETLDDFMQREETPVPPQGRYARVGFGTFAFVQPVNPPKKLRARRPRASADALSRGGSR